MEATKSLKHETTTWDKETGEQITVSKTYAIKIKQDEFYMSYIENMSGFFNLKSAIDIKVLTKFCMMAKYNTGKLVLSTAERKEICVLLEISTQQLTNSIYALRKNGLLSGSQGNFIINPAVFWKGTNETRNKLLSSEDGLSLNIVFKS